MNHLNKAEEKKLVALVGVENMRVVRERALEYGMTYGQALAWMIDTADRRQRAIDKHRGKE